MTQEDKQLLLKDLCARLPYGVVCKVKYILNNETTYGEDIEKECTDIVKRINFDNYSVYTEWLGYESDIEDIKPYLRPMSSMTEEEKEELKSKCTHTETEEDWEGVRCDVWGIQILDKYDTERWDNPIWALTINMDAIDWLLSHHFDYRGLIEKELAIKVTDENNPYKDKA